MKTLFKPTSYKYGAVLAVSTTLVWKGISFANALLLALYFGATRQTDVYFFLIMLTGFGVAFLQRLNQTVLIPEAMFLHEQQDKSARQFLTMWLYLYGGLAVVISSVGFMAPAWLWRVFSRFQGVLLAQDKWLLTCGLVMFALQIITYYLTAVAEMYKFFKTAWLGVLNALCPLACLLIWGQHVGIISMVYGFLLANVLQIGILLTLLRTQLQWNFTPAWVPVRVSTRQHIFTGQILAVLDMLNSWLPLYLMSGMGPGLVSALNYCKQITDSTTEVFTARTANIAKIKMTEELAKHQQIAANQTFVQATHVLLMVLAPLLVFSCYFAPQIVDLFFKRGQFNAQAAQDTVLFLRPMLLVLLIMVPGYLQNSAISAGRKIKESFPYALTSGLLLTAILAVLIPTKGAFWYPYLIGAGLLIGYILNAFLFHKHFEFLQYGKPLWLVVRLALWAGLALVPAVLLSRYLPQTAWVQIVGCGPVFVAIYAGILYLSKDAQKLLQEFRNHV